MSLVLHYAPMTSATRIVWALEELGVPYEKVKVDLAAGEQRQPAYLALNPNGKVPLLVHDGQPIFESLAILVHLGETFGVERGLYPAPGLARARALVWMAWAQVTLGEALARLLRNTSDRFPSDEKNEKAAASARQEIQSLLGVIEGAALGGDWVVGDGFTFADLALVGFLPFLARLGADYGPFPKLQAWMARCMSRPALGRAMA